MEAYLWCDLIRYCPEGINRTSMVNILLPITEELYYEIFKMDEDFIDALDYSAGIV
jgi:hypothetical protein